MSFAWMTRGASGCSVAVIVLSPSGWTYDKCRQVAHMWFHRRRESHDGTPYSNAWSVSRTRALAGTMQTGYPRTVAGETCQNGIFASSTGTCAVCHASSDGADAGAEVELDPTGS